MVLQLSSIRISQASQGSWHFSTAERLLDELFHGIERVVKVLEHYSRTYVAMTEMKGV